MAAPAATCPSAARWTWRSRSALASSRTACCTCRPPPASSPTRYRRWNGRKLKTRRAPCCAPPNKCKMAWMGSSEMLLMIDNYDSFTYNIVQYFGELGEDVRVYRNDEITIAEIEALNPDRICISPGPKDPAQAGISIAVLKHFAGKKTILGVCLGHQAIGEAFGGKEIGRASCRE